MIENVATLKEMLHLNFSKSDADRGKKRMGKVHQRNNSVYRRAEENRES